MNRKEYVLVYDRGEVYFSFHERFRRAFEIVIAEWSAGMRASGRHPDHEAILIRAPDEEVEDSEDKDDAGDIEVPFEEDTLADGSYLKEASEGTRPRHPSSVSRDSGISVGHVTGTRTGQPLELVDVNAQAQTQPPPPPLPSSCGGQSPALPRSSNSVNSPERVRNQPRSPLPESDAEPRPVRSDLSQRNKVLRIGRVSVGWGA
jgi:hypothetical protein